MLKFFDSIIYRFIDDLKDGYMNYDLEKPMYLIIHFLTKIYNNL